MIKTRSHRQKGCVLFSRCIFKACLQWQWFENHPPHSCFTMCLQGCGHMVIMLWLISFRRLVLQWFTSLSLSIFVFVGWRWWKWTKSELPFSLLHFLKHCSDVAQSTGNLGSHQNVTGIFFWIFKWNQFKVVFLVAKVNLKTYFLVCFS